MANEINKHFQFGKIKSLRKWWTLAIRKYPEKLNTFTVIANFWWKYAISKNIEIGTK